MMGWALAQQKPAPPLVRMVQLGELRPGIIVPTGEWLALIANRDGFGWERLRVARKANRLELEEPRAEAPLFLLRGLPLLATKPVHTCFDRSETGSLQEQNPILLTCEAHAYRVEVTSAGALQFRHQTKTQTLRLLGPHWRDQRVELVWAGDLDGDDRVDLLVDHGKLTLYLSSNAAAGQLVGRAASSLN